jgi:hypothetical protein
MYIWHILTGAHQVNPLFPDFVQPILPILLNRFLAGLLQTKSHHLAKWPGAIHREYGLFMVMSCRELAQSRGHAYPC